MPDKESTPPPKDIEASQSPMTPNPKRAIMTSQDQPTEKGSEIQKTPANESQNTGNVAAAKPTLNDLVGEEDDLEAVCAP